MQLGFAALNVVLCVQFYYFVKAAQTTTFGPLPARPAGVEGWLPISGMMGAIDWIAQGSLNSVHPAATILFLAFVAISLVFRKAFCSWLCPIGTLSEGLAKLGRRRCSGAIFCCRGSPTGCLMSVKYLLLGFFVYFFFLMGAKGIAQFIDSPYNQVADVKMMLFFFQLGTVGAMVILALAIGSVFVKGFWCRYLCPYGAVLGLLQLAVAREGAAQCEQLHRLREVRQGLSRAAADHDQAQHRFRRMHRLHGLRGDLPGERHAGNRHARGASSRQSKWPWASR